MKILYLTDNPNLGSTARILQSWLTLGRHAGIEANVVTQRPGPLSDWLADENVRRRCDPMPWFNRRRPLEALGHAWRVARWAKAGGVRLIHCNEHNVYPFATLVRRFLHVPVVCHVRFKVERGFCEWAFGGRHRLPNALLWTSQQQCDDCQSAVEGVVPADRQHLVRLGLDVASYGADQAQREVYRRQWGLRPEDVVVGVVCALKPIKRIEDFIELICRLARRHDSVVGLIAGGVAPGHESYAEEIERRIRATGLGRRLQLVGHLEPVEPFHHACDITVSTSEYETFGNSVLEAMACRRPVVAYRGGSVHEVVGDAGRIVATGNVDGLTAAVDEFISRPELGAELGRKGRMRVAEYFDPRDSFTRLLDIYRSVID